MANYRAVTTSPPSRKGGDPCANCDKMWASTYSFVVYGELVRALTHETNYHWGMTGQTVSKWRRILGFTGETPSALAINSERFKGVVGRKARRAGKPTLSSPERAAKISAAKSGVPRSEATEVAQRTERSLRAVYIHRSRLGINTGRKDRHRT